MIKQAPNEHARLDNFLSGSCDSYHLHNPGWSGGVTGSAGIDSFIVNTKRQKDKKIKEKCKKEAINYRFHLIVGCF